METRQERVAMSTHRVTLDMLFFAAQMVVLGIGVAIAVSVPVIVWAVVQ